MERPWCSRVGEPLAVKGGPLNCVLKCVAGPVNENEEVPCRSLNLGAHGIAEVTHSRLSDRTKLAAGFVAQVDSGHRDDGIQDLRRISRIDVRLLPEWFIPGAHITHKLFSLAASDACHHLKRGHGGCYDLLDSVRSVHRIGKFGFVVCYTRTRPIGRKRGG
jgi:hypothetical protein